MEVAEAPAVVHEVGREPVEQRGDCRRAAVVTEVGDGRHQAGSEMAGPDMVDGDAGGQRMVRPDEPAGEGEPAAGALRRVRRQWPRCPGSGERFSARLPRRGQCLPGVGERLRRRLLWV